MAQTQIEWTHRRHPVTGKIHAGYTFNPWIGCTKVGGSPACRLCYAADLDDRRFSKTLGGATLEHPISHWGKGAPRHRTKTWLDPLRWNREAERAGMALAVFCASLADWADEEVSDTWRDDLFSDVILKCPNLDFLLLTKRTANARRYLEARGCPGNVWLGATMENQANFDRRIMDLLSVKGPAVHFASMEPLLGAVDLGSTLLDPMDLITQSFDCCAKHAGTTMVGLTGNRLGWIIAGGESCHDDRTKSTPTHPDDALKVATQAWSAGVPFYWKQWGDWAPAYELDENPQAQAMCLAGKVPRRDLVYGDGGRRLSFNVGKTAAGRLFEGEKRDAMPRIRLIG